MNKARSGLEGVGKRAMELVSRFWFIAQNKLPFLASKEFINFVKKIAPLAILSIATIIIFWPLLTNQNIIVGNDAQTQGYPYFAWADHMVDSGYLPLWSDNIYNGFPIFATVSNGVLNPITILLLSFTGWATTYHLTIVGGILLAQIAMYCLARSLGFNRWASIFTAIIFSFSDWYIFWFHFPADVAAMAALPVSFLLVQQTTNGKPISYFVGGSIILGLLGLSGHPQLFTYAITCATAYAIYLAIHHRSKKVIATWFFVICVVVVIASLQWAPLFQLIHSSSRTQGLLWSEATWESTITLPTALNILIPGVAWLYTTTHVYSIWPAWIIAIYLLCQRHTWKTKGLQFFAGLLIFSVLSGLAASPLFYLQHLLPIFSSFRGPGRWMFVGMFALALCVGYGWNRWMASGVPQRFIKLLWVVAAMSTAAALSALVLLPGTWFIPVLRANTIVVLCTTVVLFIYSRSARYKTATASLLLSIMLIQSFVVCWQFIYNDRAMKPFTQPHWLTTTANDRAWSFASYFWYYAQNDVAPYRRILNNLGGNAGLIYGTSIADGYDNAVNSRQAEVNQLLHGYGSKVLERPEQRRAFNLQTARDEFLTHKQFLDDAGVTIVISPIALTHDQLHLVNEPPTTPLWHYTNTSAADWAYATTSVTTTSSLNNLETYTTTRRDGVVIECAPNCSPTAPGTSTIQQIVDQPHLTTFQTQSSSNQWLVVARSWDKDWYAKVDEKSVPIYHANYLFQGIYIPAGDHVVELRYEPWVTKIPGLRGWVYHE